MQRVVGERAQESPRESLLLSYLLLVSWILAISMATQELHGFHGTIAWGDMGEPDGLGRCRGWDA